MTVREGALEPGPGSAGPPLEVVALLGTFDPALPVEAEPVHALVRAFRAGDPGAFAEVARAGHAAIMRHPLFRGPASVGLVVPGHDGTPSARLVELLGELAPAAGWTRADPRLLVRLRAVDEAKTGGPRDPAAELASLKVDAGLLPTATATLVLVDDVVASGGTMAACVAALRRAGWSGSAAGLAIARAMASGGPRTSPSLPGSPM